MAVTENYAKQLLRSKLTPGVEVLYSSCIDCCCMFGTSDNVVWYVTVTANPTQVTITDVNMFTGVLKSVFLMGTVSVFLTTDGVFMFKPLSGSTKILDLAIDPDGFYYITCVIQNGITIIGIIGENEVAFHTIRSLAGYPVIDSSTPIAIPDANLYLPLIDPIEQRFMLVADRLIEMHAYGGSQLLDTMEILALADRPVGEVEHMYFSNKRRTIVVVDATYPDGTQGAKVDCCFTSIFT